ncbi:S-adenosyl-L-methionine-dependent methyltransferases superfamily protein [Actinidia rufa]|uniref:S-adenosyl-L-methionine-dependent methyltransferases superfamily protein n=1 Tax=Actinidia rufa TaxID=165716 RepID=A0A7J0G4U0_9ERIC|nr:S-adenosyl-L-methionine-dependent methyltransferases superfamily protein [Actinidia rufa]
MAKMVVVGLRFHPRSSMSKFQKLVKLQGSFNSFFPSSSSSSCSSKANKPFSSSSRHLSFFAKSTREYNQVAVSTPEASFNLSSTWVAGDSPTSGGPQFSWLGDVMMGYILGQKRATEVAHSVWKRNIQKGDIVIDATCGNGYDTLEMVKMVSDKSCGGRVFAMDVQKVALENTASLLDESLKSDERGLVELFAICHSKMEQVVPSGVPVRLVAFNLGYLPGGDKAIITRSETTLQALEAAKRLLSPGGLISIVAYVGHPGGRDEFEAVEAFASGLPVENWICCKLQMLNRPLAPVLVLLVKR